MIFNRSLPVPPYNESTPVPPYRVSSPALPSSLLAAVLPVTALFNELPAPSSVDRPVKIRFSTLAGKVKLTDDVTVSVPAFTFSIIKSSIFSIT
ncbi:MAG: hypothetical protein EPN89_02660 [Methylovulum sp.]|nr:MAG: hypothetical protein EPN89_02660 [Methylovulum sp.]